MRNKGGKRIRKREKEGERRKEAREESREEERREGGGKNTFVQLLPGA